LFKLALKVKKGAEALKEALKRLGAEALKEALKR